MASDTQDSQANGDLWSGALHTTEYFYYSCGQCFPGILNKESIVVVNMFCCHDIFSDCWVQNLTLLEVSISYPIVTRKFTSWFKLRVEQYWCIIIMIIHDIPNNHTCMYWPTWRQSGVLFLRPCLLRVSSRRLQIPAGRGKKRFTTLRLRKMAAIMQTKFSNAFFCMKTFDFWLTLHWSLFLGVQLTIHHHWFR